MSPFSDRPSSAAPRRDSSERGLGLILVLLALEIVAALGVMQYRWFDPPFDRFESRQAQTALTVYWMAKDSFLSAPLPVFGPPWSVPMEFPLYQGFVVVAMKTLGLSLVPAARGVSVALFLLMLPAIWRIGRDLGWSRPEAALGMLAALSPPVLLFYGRAVLIETTAVCAAAWFFAAQLTALRTRTPGRIAIAALLGVLAGLAKMTTFLVFAVPIGFCAVAALLACVRAGDRSARRRVLIAGLIPLALAFVVNLGWIAWSDAIKNSNPLAQPFKSANLHGWHYGTVGVRFTSEYWWRICTHTLSLVLSPGALFVTVAAAAFVGPRARGTALGFTLAYLCGPLAFPTLYSIHDYYACGNAILLMFAAAAVLGALWREPAVPTRAAVVMTLLFVAGQWAQFIDSFWAIRRTTPPHWPITEAIRRATPPDDVFVVFGGDWGSLWAYDSERRAIMVRSGEESKLQRVLATLPAHQHVATVMIRDHYRKNPAFVAEQVGAFDLAPLPIAEDDDAALYVRRELLPWAVNQLSAVSRPDLTINLPGVDDAEAAERKPIDAPARTPAHFRAPFLAATGIAAIQSVQVDGEDAWFVHAPGELVFAPPPGSHALTLDLGMMPDAYTATQGSTDGVEIVVFERIPGGVQRALLRATLRPFERHADRGTQHLQFEQREPFQGEIVLRLASGPAHRNHRDWIYLQGVDLR